MPSTRTRYRRPSGRRPRSGSCCAKIWPIPSSMSTSRASSSSSDDRRLQRLDEIEYRLRVPRYLDATPFLCEPAVGVDDERAAFDSADFFAVHFFHLDDVELTAELFLGIR